MIHYWYCLDNYCSLPRPSIISRTLPVDNTKIAQDSITFETVTTLAVVISEVSNPIVDRTGHPQISISITVFTYINCL